MVFILVDVHSMYEPAAPYALTIAIGVAELVIYFWMQHPSGLCSGHSGGDIPICVESGWPSSTTMGHVSTHLFGRAMTPYSSPGRGGGLEASLVLLYPTIDFFFLMCSMAIRIKAPFHSCC